MAAGGNMGVGLGFNQKNEVFQGDMNAIIKNNMAGGIGSGNIGNPIQEKKQFDLFSDNFIQNYQKDIQSKNNENMNIINSIFGNANPSSVGVGVAQNPSTAESERERRLKLRELERLKRQEGINGGDYGQVQNGGVLPETQSNPQVSYIQNNIFGNENQNQKPLSAATNKRDQIWQQKMQQRLGSHEGQRVPIHQTPAFQPQNISQQLPIFQNQGLAPIHSSIEPVSQNFNLDQMQRPDSDSRSNNVRSSRVLSIINDARKLDQSINLEVQKQQQPNQVQSNPLFGADDDLIKKRRENEKMQRQREYQEFLAKQNQGAKQIKPVSDIQSQQNISTTLPSSSQSNQRPSQRSNIGDIIEQQPQIIQQNPTQNNVLMQGGLQQLGMKESVTLDEKQRKQREYKQFLDQQNLLKQQQKNAQPVPLTQDRKKELSDQIFSEIMSNSKQNFYQPPQNMQINQAIAPKQLFSNGDLSQPRSQGDVSGSRDIGGALLKNQISEEDQKRMALEKKKEYAQQLQQQMALKQQLASDSRGRRGTSQMQQQQDSQPNLMGFGNPQQDIKPVFEYQQQFQQQIPTYNQVIQPSIQPQTFGLPQNNQFAGFQQPIGQPNLIQNFNDQFGYQPPVQYPSQLSPMNFVQNQPIAQGFQHEMNIPQQQNNQPDPQALARQKQEEYRRELEMQIKLKEEQKRQQQLSQQLYDQKQDKDFAQLLSNDSHNIHKAHSSNQILQDPYSLIQQQQQQLNFQSQQNPQQMPPPSAASQQSNFVRQRTDVSRQADPQQDQQKQLKQQQYQEELKRQMEEKNRQKEEEKRRLKLEEEEHERKLQMEIEILNQRQHEELVKDGKRDPNAPYSGVAEKKRQVRRDQFEPSADNPNAVSKIPTANVIEKQNFNAPPVMPNDPWTKANPVQEKESIFGNDIKPSIGLDLPINGRRDDLFGKGPGQAVQQSYDNFASRDLGYPSSQQPYYDKFQQPSLQQNSYPTQSYHQINSQINPYPTSQPSLGFQQPSLGQNNNMIDEQSKVIQMYQTALQQILEIKNQFYEQALQMNEKLIKEREQLLEYEKMKSQQNQEIQSLQAVYHQLGNLLQPRPVSNQSAISNSLQQNYQNPILNPQIQNNLNNLIQQQKADILRLSQSGGLNLAQLRSQNQQMNYQANNQQKDSYMMPQIEEQPNILEQSLSSDTKFVIVPQNKLAQIAVQSQSGTQLFTTWKQDQLAGVQNNTQLNQQTLQQQNIGSSGFISDLHAQNQNLNQQTLNASMMKSLAGQSTFIQNPISQPQIQNSSTPQKLSNLKPVLPIGLHSRPQTSTLPPETIVEMPKEEDDQVNQSKQGLSLQGTMKQQQQEELDFNSRESSRKGSEERKESIGVNDNQQVTRVQSKISNSNMATIQQNMITNTNPLGNTTTIQENMLQIDNLLNNQGISIENQNQQTHQTPKTQLQQPLKMTQQHVISPSNRTIGNHPHQAGATGSSFFNQTLYQQKQQEQSQMEELQKQLMRIFGNTNDGSAQNQGILQQMLQKPATPLLQQRQRDNNSSQYVQSQQDNLNQQQPSQSQLQQQNNNYQNPLQRASFNEKMNTLNQDEKEFILRQSNINIADSMTGTEQIQEIVQIANKKFSSNGFYAAPQQYDQQIIDETKNINEDKEEFQEAQKVEYNDKPLVSQKSNKQFQFALDSKGPSDIKHQYEESTQQFQNNDDIWNDPDLIPPPVVMMGNEDDDYYYEPQLNQSQYNQAGISQGPSGYNQSMIQDGTLKNLQMFSPPSDENNYNLGMYEESQGYNQSQNGPNAQEQYYAQDYQNQQEQNQIQQNQQYMEKTSGSAISKINDQMSERSKTKKEREIKNMMEVAKLIQQATDTTNNLFENSNNFKFKIKRENIKMSEQNAAGSQNNKKPVQSQGQRKNIKTNDPFKLADAKLQNTTQNTNQKDNQPPSQDPSLKNLHSNLNKNNSKATLNNDLDNDDNDQSHINLAESMGNNVGQNQSNYKSKGADENNLVKDKDDDILANLDRMIMNLQAQQQKCSDINPQIMGYQNNQNNDDFNQREDNDLNVYQDNNAMNNRGRPISGIPRPTSNRSKSNKKQWNRPISAVDAQNQQDSSQKLGKYAQMALQNDKQADQKSQRSQKSLGKFAQMAVGGVENQQIIQEVQSKYIGDQDAHMKQVMEQLQQIQQQNILRPVSGKSNSNRYGQHQKTSSQSQRQKSGGRVGSNGRNIQYFEDESDDYTNQIQQFNKGGQDENYNYHFQQDGIDESKYNNLHQPFSQPLDDEDQQDQYEQTSGFNIGYEQNHEEPEYD